MSETQETYTYQGGEKVVLRKRPDQLVVRALPGALREAGFGAAEQMSSASSRLVCRPEDLEDTMVRARAMAVTHHAYEREETGEEFLLTDRIFVRFGTALSSEEVAAFAGRYGLIQLETLSDRDCLFQLTDHTGMNPVKLVVRLTETAEEVDLAEHDLNVRIETYQPLIPNDTFYRRQWHLHGALDHPQVDPRASSGCEQAWQALGGFGDAQVVVAVTDDGCRLDHGDFNGPDKFAGWGYFRGTRLINDKDVDAEPANMYQAGANHGTSCAGVVAGEVDGALTVGAAPGCRLLPIKWESTGVGRLAISGSKLRTALDFLADKVDVMSNSWATVPTTFWPTVVTERITALARDGGRRGKGIVFLWAAGNANCPISHVASVDVPYTSGWDKGANGAWRWIGVKTARLFTNSLVELPGVLHVAAVASNAHRSHYSNYGSGIGLSAPSSNAHAYSRLRVPGLRVTTATGTTSGVTARFGGTSSATPLVAGVAALVISADPALGAEEVIAILKHTASKDLSFESYARTTPTSYDGDTSWDVSPVAPFDSGEFQDLGLPEGSWSPWFGHGRVDAAAAVSEALQGGGAAPASAGAGPSPDPDPSGNGGV